MKIIFVIFMLIFCGSCEGEALRTETSSVAIPKEETVKSPTEDEKDEAFKKTVASIKAERDEAALGRRTDEPLLKITGKSNESIDSIFGTALSGGKEIKSSGDLSNGLRAKVVLGKAKVTAGDLSTVRRVLRRKLNGFKYCYERQLMKNPEITGQVMMQAKIRMDGRVGSSTIAKSTMNSASLEKCLLAMLKRTKFPASKKEMTLTFPLVFTSIKK